MEKYQIANVQVKKKTMWLNLVSCKHKERLNCITALVVGMIFAL